MIDLNVQQTTEYDKFRTIFGNRFVNQEHVDRLAASISERNLMMYQPALVNEEFYIIDGQHRILACKKLGIEVYYIMVPGLSLRDVRRINSHMKAWSIGDFVDSHAMTGNPDYHLLQKFAEEFGLPVTVAGHLLSGQVTISGGGEIRNIIRDGDFKVTDEQNARVVATKLNDIRPFTDGSVYRSREFIRGLIMLYEKGADHQRLLEQLAKWPDKIKRQVSYREYLFLLGDIYNHRRREKITILK